MAIKFGTDGWRGIISEDFTFNNVCLVVRAMVNHILAQRPKHPLLIVGYDTRFLSQRYAALVAEIATDEGVDVFLSSEPLPTPMLSFAVNHLQASGGIVVTASHNPPEYNGLKFKEPFGGPALPATIQAIEAHINKAILEPDSRAFGEHDIDRKGWVKPLAINKAYYRHLSRLVDMEKIGRTGLKVVIDPMYGAGQGYLSGFLRASGIEVMEIHSEKNFCFGGLIPEPIAVHLDNLARVVKEQKADIGLALDGDADRIGAVDSRGRFVNSHYIYSVILKHLVEARHWEGGVVKTFSTSQMVDKLAGKYELTKYETPIGFKFISDLMLHNDVLIGGEESGGIGIKNHIPERDGQLSALMLLEAMAVRSCGLEDLAAELTREFGQHYYERIDLEISVGKRELLLKRLRERPPLELIGRRVVKVEDLDRVKFFFSNGAWVLFRGAGTEPMLRIYAESPSLNQVAELLNAGQELFICEP